MKEFEKYISEIEKNLSAYTVSSYKDGILPFLEYFNIENLKDIENISKDDILEYRGQISGKTSTVNARMRTINAFINWMLDMEYIEKNPINGIRNLKEPKKEKLFLEDDEVIRLIDACDNLQEQVMMSLMVTSGIRVTEVTEIKVSDIDGNHILIHGKGDKERVVAIQSWLMDAMQKHIKKLNRKGEEYLFPSRKGGGKVTRHAIYYRIKRIAKNANIDESRLNKLTPHSTRRYFATSLINDGVSIKIVQRAMGHASINTTNRYVKVFDKTVENAVNEKFSNLNGEK